MGILKLKSLLLLCLLIFVIGMKTLADKTTDNSELPLKKILIEVTKEQRDIFFDGFKAFAEKHGFAVRVALTTPSGDDFVVEMHREDFKILGVNTFDSEKFQIGVYKNNRQEIPSTYLDSLLNDFYKSMRLIGLEPTNL